MTREVPDLSSIRILYCENDTMSLWGIPYRMRPGQQPADLRENLKARASWIWLGQPGWWGSLTPEERARREAFVRKHERLGQVPEHPNEWIYI